VAGYYPYMLRPTHLDILNDSGALSVVELAEILGCNPATCFRQAYKGILPHYRVGRLLRFNGPEVAAHFRSKR
jgi:excisionase family DNA binding protein